MANKKKPAKKKQAANLTEPIKAPLTPEEFLARVGPDHRIRAVFAIELERLACCSSDGTLDGLNEIVDAEVWAGCPSLADIGYRAVGVTPDGKLDELVPLGEGAV